MFNFCPLKPNDREGLTYNSASGRKNNTPLKFWEKILMDYLLPQLPQSAIFPYVYLQSSSHSFHVNGGSFDHIITFTNDKLLYWLM
jgi:hypothetical protein